MQKKTVYDTASIATVLHECGRPNYCHTANMSTLNGTVLRIVTRLDNAYTYDVEVLKIEKGQKAKYELVGGYGASIIQELSHLLDFKLELVTDPPNLAYKFHLADNYSVDMFAASYSVRQDRSRFADLTFVTGRSRARVFLNRAFEGSMHDVVIAPFASSVWLTFSFAILLLSVVFCFVTFYLERVRYSSSFFQIISVFLMRDAKLHVQSSSPRFIQLTASITVFLLVSAYAAKIFSIGAIRVASITTLAQLVTSIYDISYDRGYGNGSSLQYYAETLSKNPVMSEILSKAQGSNFRYDNFGAAMREVQSRPFAYIIDEETAYYAAEKALGRVPCQLGSISFAGVQYQWSMLMRKGFEHRPAINFGILRLAETGALKQLALRWIPGRGVDSTACSTWDFGQFSRVQLTQLQTAFYILVAGGFFSCIFLLTELFSKKLLREIKRGFYF